VRSGRHPLVSAISEAPRAELVVGLGSDASERIEGEDLNRGVTPELSVHQDLRKPLCGIGNLVLGVQRSEQAFAERGLLATGCRTVPRYRLFCCCSRAGAISHCPADACEMNANERCEAHVPRGLCLRGGEVERRRTDLVVAGLALGATKA
jgi:hypothetical protein